MTVAHLRDVVVAVTPFTFKHVKIGPNLPVDLSPRDSVLFSYIRHELFQVPRSINDVLSSDLSIIVDIGLGFGAV